MSAIITAIAGMLAVAGAAAVAPRLRIAAPLILVILGIAVSFVPAMPAVEVEPEWILAGILPPLLYSASVSMPSMDFRREFSAIGGFSVVLVVISAVVLGFFFSAVVPGLTLWWGIALGAIVSPTDAAAISIVKQAGVSGRVVSVLEGESLLNDATALVLLRTAIAATATAVSVWSVVGTFLFSVIVACILGVLVGKLSLWARSKITDSTVNTVASFTVPFLASIPAELLGASGLVAAVVAGLITGHGAPRHLPPQHRMSDTQNWHAMELVLEGAVFLIMGLELSGIVADVRADHNSIGTAVAVAAGALALTVVIRAAYTAPLLAMLGLRARRGQRVKPHLERMRQHIEGSGGGRQSRAGRAAPSHRLDRMLTRLRRAVSDIDYLLAAPLGWRDGGVLVWAGMRGAVTLAAAQTLPADTPNRSLLILIAFVVAAASLLVQGGTLAAAVAWIKPTRHPQSSETERAAVLNMLAAVRTRMVDAEGQAAAGQAAAGQEPSRKRLELNVLEAQRAALLDARDDGRYGAATLNHALQNLDADQISIELKGAPGQC